MKPTYQQTHIDVPLTNLSVAYVPDGFIAEKVFPAVPVQKISNKYFIYSKADWLRRDADVRAPGTRAARGGYAMSSSTYACVEYAIGFGVPDEISDNMDSPLSSLSDGTKWVTQQIYLQKESLVAAEVFGNSKWTGSGSATTAWENDTSVPITDVAGARSAISGSIGMEANTGVVGREVWRYLEQHPDIVERIKYTAGPGNPAIVTVNAVAALFGLDKSLVGGMIENPAAEGITESMSYIWGKHCWIGYVTRGPSLMVPSAGYLLTYKSRQIERFREDQEHQDVITGRESWDTVLVAPDAGYLLKSVVS